MLENKRAVKNRGVARSSRRALPFDDGGVDEEDDEDSMESGEEHEAAQSVVEVVEVDQGGSFSSQRSMRASKRASQSLDEDSSLQVSQELYVFGVFTGYFGGFMGLMCMVMCQMVLCVCVCTASRSCVLRRQTYPSGAAVSPAENVGASAINLVTWCLCTRLRLLYSVTFPRGRSDYVLGYSVNFRHKIRIVLDLL
eukprot:COSAG01_NODE_2070_length_8500_cov_7.053803_8_plen_196_part_00